MKCETCNKESFGDVKITYLAVLVPVHICVECLRDWTKRVLSNDTWELSQKANHIVKIRGARYVRSGHEYEDYERSLDTAAMLTQQVIQLALDFIAEKQKRKETK